MHPWSTSLTAAVAQWYEGCPVQPHDTGQGAIYESFGSLYETSKYEYQGINYRGGDIVLTQTQTFFGVPVRTSALLLSYMEEITVSAGLHRRTLLCIHECI